DFQSQKIISSLTVAEQELLVQQADSLIFKKGKLIFYDGGVPTGVFWLKSGRAKIFKTGPYDRDQIFYIYKTGDLLGYHALLCQENYEDSCEALEDCEVLFINQHKFEELLSRIPRLKNLIIQNMAHEFGVMVNMITVMAQKTLRSRLALFLLILEKRYREKVQPTAEGAINISREDLANIVGTTRESLARLLKEFRTDQLITIDKRKIRLANYPQLLKLASQ
ncbi:MAG: Crp/Fnr family transcriptional regulator, partial [Bacteroidetes bacterium]